MKPKFDPQTQRWADVTPEQFDDETLERLALAIKAGKFPSNKRAELLEFVSEWRMRLEVTGCESIADYQACLRRVKERELAEAGATPERPTNANRNAN